MAQYATLKAAIDAVIKANGQREITGTVLNQTLNAMVNSLGANYQLAGVATPSTNPGTPDQNVFYLAFEAGTYTNFNATVLSAGISILMWNGSWSSQTFYTIDATPTASSNNLVSSGAVFDAIKTDGSAYDVSAHFPTAGPNNDGKFTLEYILNNANTLIPAAWRKGGMSIRFVQSSDNKYVQYRLMNQYFRTTESDWQGVNDEPIAGSDSLVKSNGMMESGGSVFSITGDGTTVVNDIVHLKKLIVGKTYLLYAPKWAMSEIGDTQTVFQLYYSDGVTPTVVAYIQKKDVKDNYFVEFTAQQPNYSINFRGNSGMSAYFKIREKDAILDNGYQFMGVATPSTQPVWGKVYYIATESGSYTNFGLNIANKGLYIFKPSDNGWNADVLYRVDTVATEDSQNMIESGAVFSACKKVAIQGAVPINITGNGDTVVAVNYAIKGMTIGKKYIIYATKWDMAGVSDNNAVLNLYYSGGGQTTQVLRYTKADFPNILRFVYTAENTWLSAYFRGAVGVTATIYWREYSEVIDGIIDGDNGVNIPSIIPITGNGTNVVQQSITNLIIGQKYVIYSPKWAMSDIADNVNVFLLYHSEGSTITDYQVTKGDFGNYLGLVFTAKAQSYGIYFRGNASTVANIELFALKGESSAIVKHLESIDEAQAELIAGLNVKMQEIDNKTYGKATSSDKVNEVILELYADTNSFFRERAADVIAINLKTLEDTRHQIIFRYNNHADEGFTFANAAFGIYKWGDVYVYVKSWKDAGLVSTTLDTDKLVDLASNPIIAGYLGKTGLDNRPLSVWSGKSIVWYGTSIPTCGYPQQAALAIGATMNNFAKGASACVAGGNNYLAYQVNLGHTIAQKVAAVKDMWTIDDVNQTFTNGPRTMGITGIPSLTTYAEVAAARLEIITASYECLILARTLLSNQSEHDAFLQNALGDLYTYMTANYAARFAYRNVDLWVFDHGHNDDCSTPPDQLNMSQVNVTSFVGAMNTYIGLIYQYKPHARICVVSDYDDFDEYTKKYTIETQKAIADRWHLPFIPIHQLLPLNINTKVRTRGYWDADAVWHDTGFEWGALDTDNGMIGNGHFPPYIIYKFYESGRPARTIQELEELLNPSQDAAGNWWYDLEPRYIWLFDGLHPHSVPYGNVTRMYAQCLIQPINAIGTNGYL